MQPVLVEQDFLSVFGCERLTGALLDRLTHHVHILEMNGNSYRLATARKAQRRNRQLVGAFEPQKEEEKQKT